MSELSENVTEATTTLSTTGKFQKHLKNITEGDGAALFSGNTVVGEGFPSEILIEENKEPLPDAGRPDTVGQNIWFDQPMDGCYKPLKPPAVPHAAPPYPLHQSDQCDQHVFRICHSRGKTMCPEDNFNRAQGQECHRNWESTWPIEEHTEDQGTRYHTEGYRGEGDKPVV